MTLPNPPPHRASTFASLITLAMVLAATACSTALAPTTPTYVMTGTVRVSAADGAVVAGADVRILESSGGGTPTTTDANGDFRLPSLMIGRHFLEISKSGFGVWEGEFDVVDRDLRLEVVLHATSADS